MAINSDKRVIHRFIREISAYEFGGELYSQIIPVDTQAYAIYPNKEGNRFFYVIGDGEHTYTEIRDGKGIGEACKEYPVFTEENLNVIFEGVEEEARERKAADELLQTHIDEEELARIQEDSRLQENIDVNKQDILELQASLNQEASDRAEADSELKSSLQSEKSERETADEDLYRRLNNEEEERRQFDDLLDEAIGEEISNRETAIQTLSDELNDKINTHISDKENPHNVTKAQVGLSNVDNTADVDKPVSTAQQTELNKKVDKVNGYFKIYGTDENGSQTTYDLDSFGKVDDVRVGGTSVVTNKIANLGTMASETASDYSTKAVADTLYADKIETEQALAGKQNNLTQPQLDAVNSGVTSTLVGQITTNQTNIGSIEEKIPAQASSENKLADKEFVNSSIATNTAHFIGTFANTSELEEYSDPITNNDYAFVINSLITNDDSDWETFNALDEYNKDLLTNFDYAWVINGSNFDLYRFDIIEQEWDLRASNITKESVTLNTAYNRYKANVEDNVVTWEFEYTLNNSSFTANQWAAINSGATSEKIGQIATNVEAINTINSSAMMTSGITSTKVSNYDTHIADTTIHVTSSDKQTWNAKQNALTAGSNIQIDGDVISATDTTYTAGVGINIENGVITNTRTTYVEFPSTWTTDGTVAQLMADVTADTSAVKGMSYLGEVTCSDLPFNGNGEMRISIMDGSDGRQGKVIFVELESGNVSPYHWDMIWWNNQGTWRSFIPTSSVDNSPVSGSSNVITSGGVYTALSGKQDNLTAGNNIDITNGVISATDTTYTAGTGIDITDGVISNTQTSAEWGNITGTLSDQTDLQSALNDKQDVISDLSDIRSGASAGATALQPNDNVSELINDVGYITGISSSDVTTALGYTPVDPSNLATVATTGDYDDLSNKPTIPVVNDATLTITQGGISKGTFTANASVNTTIDLDASVDIDNTTITKNSSDLLQTVGVINKRSNSSETLKFWEGNQSQFTTDSSGQQGKYGWVYSDRYLGYTTSATPSVGDTIDINGYELAITETDSSTYVTVEDSGDSLRFDRATEYDIAPVQPIIDTHDLCFIEGKGVKKGDTFIANNGLTNDATGTNSLTILGTPTSNSSSINIGVNSSVGRVNSVVIGNAATSDDSMCTNIGASSSTNYRSVSVGYSSQSSRDSVAIGSSAKATANYTIAIGQNSKADQQNAIAIGTSAKAQAQGAIQIGGKTNIDANTLKVGTYGYDNWTLLNLATGKIPSERLDIQNITNQNTDQSAVTPLKVWEGSSAQYASQQPVIVNYYGWLFEQMFRLVTNTETPQIGDICYMGQWGEGDPYTITDTDGATYIISNQIGTASASRDSTLDYSETISVWDDKTLCFVEGVGVKIGNTLIADYTTLDNAPTQSSTNSITSGAVYDSLLEKLDKVSTVNVVYGTDAQGDQTTYQVSSFGAVDDVQVNGTSIVSNKIANFTVDNAPIQSSTNLITSGGVYSAIPSIIMRDWSSNNNSNL